MEMDKGEVPVGGGVRRRFPEELLELTPVPAEEANGNVGSGLDNSSIRSKPLPLEEWGNREPEGLRVKVPELLLVELLFRLSRSSSPLRARERRRWREGDCMSLMVRVRTSF